ncbi:MAG: dihydroorotate dehydrogenase electron transfer subunit [Lachnospiraceae bacterium]|nr:dihydroorotate dehydrogenase electron transfer subunit [Lachnospiraceae bacterium]
MSGTKRARVISRHELCAGIFSLVLDCSFAGEIKAGQFVNLYLDDGTHLLPRPVSVCDADVTAQTVTLVYRVVGFGTEYFSQLREGDTVRMLGPLGNGYPVDELYGKKVMAVGGGLGIPPMLYLTKMLCDKGVNVQTVLGYRDEAFLYDEFKETGVPVYTASDTGSIGTKGTVIDAIRQNGLGCDVICACGPLPMLKALKDYAKEAGIRLYVSLEERMACGLGACLGCVCESVGADGHSHVHNKRVCKDGPVFDAGEVVL